MGEDFWDNFLPQLFEGGGEGDLMPGGFDEIEADVPGEGVEQADENADDEPENRDEELQAAGDDDQDSSSEEEPVPVCVRRTRFGHLISFLFLYRYFPSACGKTLSTDFGEARTPQKVLNSRVDAFDTRHACTMYGSKKRHYDAQKHLQWTS